MESLDLLKFLYEISISSYTGYTHNIINSQIDYKTSFTQLERSPRISTSFKRKSNYQIEEKDNRLKKRKNRK